MSAESVIAMCFLSAFLFLATALCLAGTVIQADAITALALGIALTTSIIGGATPNVRKAEASKLQSQSSGLADQPSVSEDI
ncbi:hypothetical protein [Pseudomonas putida]|uniref:Uncharacterized protein n=1 Tax=Pseudomonas putida TaxID=303 RepID=A0A8I1JJ43_PSEPU|nr:hypothetical protein [Pseudomonas putida]MBI6883224.1 hypothetical protein [Pseudomonas putida]